VVVLGEHGGALVDGLDDTLGTYGPSSSASLSLPTSYSIRRSRSEATSVGPLADSWSAVG
jgi:hypothetical protein